MRPEGSPQSTRAAGHLREGSLMPAVNELNADMCRTWGCVKPDVSLLAPGNSWLFACCHHVRPCRRAVTWASKADVLGLEPHCEPSQEKVVLTNQAV